MGHSSATTLDEFRVDSRSRLIVVKIDSTSDTDPEAAVNELKPKYNIIKLDTVIANAALGTDWDTTSEATPSQAVHREFWVS